MRDRCSEYCLPAWIDSNWQEQLFRLLRSKIFELQHAIFLKCLSLSANKGNGGTEIIGLDRQVEHMYSSHSLGLLQNLVNYVE